MNSVGFFTPIRYKGSEDSCVQKLMETVDDYFYLGGKVARVIPGNFRDGSQEVTLEEGTVTFWETALESVFK